MKFYYKCSPDSVSSIEAFGAKVADMSPDGSFGIIALTVEVDPLPESVEIISHEEAIQLVTSKSWQEKPVEDPASN